MKKQVIYLLLSADVLLFVLVFTNFIGALYAWIEIKPDLRKTDAIVLLSSNQFSEILFDQSAYQRMQQATQLYRDGFAQHIIICGGTQDGCRVPVSEAMKNYLVWCGVEKEAVITETTSTNTFENIKNVVPIMKSRNFTNFLLVTSSSHMYRSLAVCKKLGLIAFPAPVPCYEKNLETFMIRVRYILDILREYGAILYFKIRGWI